MKYFTSITRAICDNEEPLIDERKTAWQQYAYAIYVPGSVGEGPGVRPDTAMWSAAKEQFLNLIDELKPDKILVTGYELWKKMPETDCYMTDRLQAYCIRSTGHLAWCLALPHPANRTEGFNWAVVGKQIKLFREASFPKHT